VRPDHGGSSGAPRGIGETLDGGGAPGISRCGGAWCRRGGARVSLGAPRVALPGRGRPRAEHL